MRGDSPYQIVRINRDCREARTAFRRLVACGLVAPIALGAGLLVADEREDRAASTFFAPLEVPIVNVEVVVNDRSGKPFPGLTKDDFEVLEDGRPVEVTHFYAAPGVSSRDGVGVESVRPIDSIEPEYDIYLAIYFDDSNIDPQRRRAVAGNIRGFLQRPLPPKVQVMLAQYDGNLRIKSDFIDQPEELVPLLDQLVGEAPVGYGRESERLLRDMQNMSSSTAASFSQRSGELQSLAAQDLLQDIQALAETIHARTRADLDALEQFVRLLSGLTGRKAILWVGTGFETRAGEALFQTWQLLFPDEASNMTFNAATEARKYDCTKHLRDLVRFANAHRVSFYTLSSLAAETAAKVSGEYRSLDSEGGHAVLDPVREEEALIFMSAFTGGRNLADNFGLDQQLTEVSEELGSYYSLGYSPPSPGDGKYHKITVKVRREGVRIRYRQGYQDGGDRDGIVDRTLAAAVLGPSNNQLGISVECLEQEPRDKDTFLVPVMVRIPIGELVLLPKGDHHSGMISIHTAARDDKDRLSQVQGHEYPVEVANEHLGTAVSKEAGFIIGVVMREGPHRIAVTVRDEQSRVESTVCVDVVVGADTKDQKS